MQSISHSQISGIVLFSARAAGRNAVSQLSDVRYVLISDIFFDEASGKTLGELFAIHKGFTRCYAHQWMRVEKLVSMLLVSARDLNPQIKIFKKTFRTSVRRPTWGWGKVLIINLGFEKYFFHLGDSHRQEQNLGLFDLGSDNS